VSLISLVIQLVFMLIFSPDFAHPHIFIEVLRCKTMLEAIIEGNFIFAKIEVLFEIKIKEINTITSFFIKLFFY
jgi:hypothetical protein